MTFYDKYFIKKQLKAYVISLEKPEILFNTLKDQNMIPFLIEAINPDKLTPAIKNKNATYFFSNFGSNNSIANGMSHMKAWKKILETKEPYGIIFEDNVILTDNFYDNLVKHIKEIPKDFDIFYLGSGKFLKDINELISQPSFILGLNGYIISKKGIKKLLKSLDGKLFFHIDYCLQILGNIYSPKKKLVLKNQLVNVKSSSHPLILNKYFNYFTNSTLLQFNDFNFTISTVLIILLGFYLGYLDLNFHEITLFYLILSIPDLVELKNNSTNVHYLLFIISFYIAKKIISIK
jgi:GR25 family glycosyltransferase involved in LPS biosynthesis